MPHTHSGLDGVLCNFRLIVWGPRASGHPPPPPLSVALVLIASLPLCEDSKFCQPKICTNMANIQFLIYFSDANSGSFIVLGKY